MNYYEKYDVVVVLISLVVITGAMLVIFRRFISSLIDPIVLHFIWCASCTALLIGYVYKFGFGVNVSLFLGCFVFYVTFLYIFLRLFPNQTIRHAHEYSIPKIEVLYLTLAALTIYSKYDFILFALKSSPIEWFLYRFVLLEGRNPLQFICKLGASPFFYFFSFVLLKNKHRWKRAIIALLIVNLLIDILAGGRSSLLTFIFAYGTFVLKYRLDSQRLKRKINFYGIAMVSFSLIMAMVVSSFYSEESTVNDGALIVFDRIISAGDGLDIYLTNNAGLYLDTGFVAYFKSAFGIFLGQLFGVDTKSIGWRLYEIDSGQDIDVAAGPNYILPLQIAVLGFWSLLPYTLLAAFLVARLRTILIRGIGGNALSYVLSYNCFNMITDIEYTILIYVSTFFVYLVFVYPICHVRFSGKLNPTPADRNPANV